MNHFKPHLKLFDKESSIKEYFESKSNSNSNSSSLNNQYKKGLLEINSATNTYQVDNSEVINNRGIHNDEVIYNTNTNEIVAISHRSKQVIVGILHLNSNKKFGFTKRKVPYYKFTPVTKKVPTFIVPSKDLRRTAMICVVSFNKWETTNKHPIGQIEKLIGVVGDFNVETEMLLYKNSIYPKKNKIKYNAEEEVPGLNIYNTVSIDPPGCRDIDDALSFNILPNNKVEVSIHIANVAHLIDRLNLTTNLYSTIYLKDGNQINMLDDDITYTQLSLGNNGIPKKTMSLFLVYDIISKDSVNNHNYNYILTKSYFKEVMVKNTAISYGKSDAILTKDKAKLDNNSIYIPNSIEWMIINLANVYKSNTNTNDAIISSTKMVEYFMLLYNKITAEKLYKFNKNTILRTHKVALPSSTTFSSIHYKDAELDKYLNILNQNAAEYVTNPTNTYHESIGCQYYTHATSPIRRFIDVINQLNLQIMIMNDTPYKFIEASQEYLTKINIFNKNLRKFYNNYKKLNIVYTFNNKTSSSNDDLLSDNHKFMDAYIIAIKQYKLKLYIPSLDIEHNCQPISPKLLQSNDVSIVTPTNITSSTKMIINDTILNLHDKIKIKLTVLPYEEQFNKKLFITIIEPHITLL